jgi:hypothetical protein
VAFRCINLDNGHFCNNLLTAENNIKTYLMKVHEVSRSRRNNTYHIKGKIIPVFQAFSDVVENLYPYMKQNRESIEYYHRGQQ